MIIWSEPIDTYHQSPAFSHSQLKVFRTQGPAYFKGRYIDNSIPAGERGPALLHGIAVDTLVFDGPDMFYATHETPPKSIDGKPWSLRLKACREWVAMSLKTVVSVEDWDRYFKIREAILAHPVANKMLSVGKHQVGFRRHAAFCDLDIQSRPDWLCLQEGNRYILDLKTTSEFHRWTINAPQVWKYGYYRQLALAQWMAAQEDEVGPCDCYLLVAESEEPFRVAVFRFDDDYLQLGWQEIKSDLEALSACMRTGDWGSTDEVIDLELPEWAKKKLEDGDD